MEWIIWGTLMAVIWLNNEILGQHVKNKTKPSYNFWLSVLFELFALIFWIMEVLK